LIADGSVPGDINLNATGLMAINQNSLVENVVTTGATGNGGNINVYANRFELTGGGRLRTRTLGKMRSDAGDINIKAGDIYISNPAYEMPGRDSTKEDRPALDASNYKNDAPDGSGFGKGRSGDVSLEAINGSISLIGEGEVGKVDVENKVISTYNGARAMGGGNISLKAKGSISLDNAKLVSSSIGSQSGGASDNVRVGLVEPVTRTSNSQTASIIMPKTSAVAKKIFPAQGWVLNDKGEVVLVAYDPTATTVPQRASQKTAACPAPF
jgi:hypothetical protein